MLCFDLHIVEILASVLLRGLVPKVSRFSFNVYVK